MKRRQSVIGLWASQVAPIYPPPRGPLPEGFDPVQLTFEDICRIEPQLLSLYYEAGALRTYRLPHNFCANEVWYTRLKPRLFNLVGHFARDDRLSSPRVWDLAYQTIYAALPDCLHPPPWCPSWSQANRERWGQPIMPGEFSRRKASGGPSDDSR